MISISIYWRLLQVRGKTFLEFSLGRNSCLQQRYVPEFVVVESTILGCSLHFLIRMSISVVPIHLSSCVVDSTIHVLLFYLGYIQFQIHVLTWCATLCKCLGRSITDSATRMRRTDTRTYLILRRGWTRMISCFQTPRTRSVMFVRLPEDLWRITQRPHRLPLLR
jgi:hypothetical protein